MSSNYNLQSGNVSIAVGGKYSLDDGSILKVSVVGISWGYRTITNTAYFVSFDVFLCLCTPFTFL